MKFLTLYINEYETLFLRLFFSFLLILPILFYQSLNLKIDRRSFFISFLAALVLFLYSLLFYHGVNLGQAGFGGALVTTLIPINTYILYAIIRKKTISLKHSFALVLGGFGVLTMLDIWQFSLDVIFSLDNIYFLMASVLWAILTIVSSKSLVNPLVLTFYINFIASVLAYIFFVDFSIFTRILDFDYIFWINMISLGVLATGFATSIYFIAINKYGANKISSFVFLVPSSALVLSSVFLDESLSFNILLGTICSLIAIYILNNISIRLETLLKR